MIKESSVICDFGKRIIFELDSAKNGFVKIYQAPYISAEWLHSQRIDKGTKEMSEDTALFTVFRNDLDTFYKCGCFFFTDTNAIFKASDEVLYDFLLKQVKKYHIDGHFNDAAIDRMITQGIVKFNQTKSLRKVAF